MTVVHYFNAKEYRRRRDGEVQSMGAWEKIYKIEPDSYKPRTLYVFYAQPMPGDDRGYHATAFAKVELDESTKSFFPKFAKKRTLPQPEFQLGMDLY